jgi:hypothetical protein
VIRGNLSPIFGHRDRFVLAVKGDPPQHSSLRAPSRRGFDVVIECHTTRGAPPMTMPQVSANDDHMKDAARVFGDQATVLSGKQVQVNSLMTSLQGH